MGEYAEMMLDGTLCECCGEYIGHDTGYPGYCSRQCAEDRGADYYLTDPKPHKCSVCDKGFKTEQGMRQHRREVHEARERVACPVCGKLVSCAGLDQHMEAKHSSTDSAEEAAAMEYETAMTDAGRGGLLG